MSLLSLISRAMILCGQEAPSAVMTNTDQTVVEFRTLSLIEGEELAEYDWRSLKVAYQFTGDGTTTLFDLPSDFARFMPGERMWTDGNPVRSLQRVTDDEMLAAKVAEVEPIYPYWRLIGDQVEFYPALESGTIVKTEYRRDKWITNSDGDTYKAEWTLDTDVAILPEKLIALGTAWRWKRMKGFDYVDDKNDYMAGVAKELGMNDPKPTLRTRRRVFGDGLARGVYGDVPNIVV
jgi:hypothetical protein